MWEPTKLRIFQMVHSLNQKCDEFDDVWWGCDVLMCSKAFDFCFHKTHVVKTRMESYVNISIRESVRDYFLESVEKQLNFFLKNYLFYIWKKWIYGFFSLVIGLQVKQFFHIIFSKNFSCLVYRKVDQITRVLHKL